MKLRFLAAAGPSAPRQELDARIQERFGNAMFQAFSAGPVTLWIEPGTPFLANAAGGAAAIGLLFDRASATALKRLPDVAAPGQWILANCWGAYVLLTSRGPSWSVLRDPSGSIPVYHGACRGLQLYASDAGLLGWAWTEPFQPNLDAVRQWLTYPFLRTRTTGALGVSELVPGASHDAGPEGERAVQRWSPADFAGPDPAIGSLTEAALLLRAEIMRSVPLLAAREKRTMLRLSGGLDSSIVAAALAHGGIPFRAITFATRSADGDERRYARKVARHFGIGLCEIEEGEMDLSLRADSSPLQRPPNPLLRPLRRAFASAARESADIGLVLDGAGGDNVFASLNTASPALDAWRMRGPAEGIEALRNIAALHGCTFWEAAMAAVRRAWRGPGPAWPIDRTFLAPSAVAEQAEAHPWLSGASRVLPGSTEQIRMIAGIYHFLADPGPQDAACLHPLISQPVVELCLRIPSWLWFEGGRDRAVARAAFRGILPDRILDRRAKGSLESMFVKGYMAGRSRLREFLVSGRLACEGIVDPRAIAAYLDRDRQPRDAGYIRILEIASAEQWLRSFGRFSGLPQA